MTHPRLLLFDVDGTLLSSGRHGLASFSRALEATFGTAGAVDRYPFEGKLDPVIVTELMLEAGVPAPVVEERRRAALDLYLDNLEAALALHPPTLKPGITGLLASLQDEPACVNALLTGNIERGARVKLSAAGLWHLFTFGVWGDEAALRTGLGAVALARARERTGIDFSGTDCVVIGDSRADVACGKAIGAKVVAVATGRTAPEALHEAGADVVFADLSDGPLVRQALLG